jgi:hypothetical protein
MQLHFLDAHDYGRVDGMIDLFAGAAAAILEVRLADLRSLSLRLADDKRAAALIYGLVDFFFFCQVIAP